MNPFICWICIDLIYPFLIIARIIWIAYMSASFSTQKLKKPSCCYCCVCCVAGGSAALLWHVQKKWFFDISIARICKIQYADFTAYIIAKQWGRCIGDAFFRARPKRTIVNAGSNIEMLLKGTKIHWNPLPYFHWFGHARGWIADFGLSPFTVRKLGSETCYGMLRCQF